jgi:Ni2+-binding GTPase involved in maturation of urease and hydrogenase
MNNHCGRAYKPHQNTCVCHHQKGEDYWNKVGSATITSKVLMITKL